MRPVTLCLLLLPSFALAQPMDLFGSGPKSIAMGGVQIAADDDYTAAYYNPALLWHGAVGVGINYTAPSFNVQATAEPTGEQALLWRRPVDYTGLTFGAAVPFIGLLRDKAAIGVNLFSPVRHVFRSHIIDEGTAYFLRYDNAPERIQLALSLCVRPVEWLSFGLGAQMLSNYGGYAEFTAVLGTMSAGRVIRRRLDSEVFGVFGPIAGIAVGPFKGFKAAVYWRGEMTTSFEQPIKVDLGTFGGLDVIVSGVTQYTPHTVGLGLGYTFLDGRMTVGLDVGYERWSATPPLVPQIRIDLSGTLTQLGFHPTVVSRDLEMRFTDIIVPRLGLEYRPLPQLAVRAGYIVRPSPVPDQEERSNFLDSLANVMSLGVGWVFPDPLKMGKSINVDLAGQLTALDNRYVEKKGPNLQPNYRFGGTNVLVNFAVKYQF